MYYNNKCIYYQLEDICYYRVSIYSQILLLTIIVIRSFQKKFISWAKIIIEELNIIYLY